MNIFKKLYYAFSDPNTHGLPAFLLVIIFGVGGLAYHLQSVALGLLAGAALLGEVVLVRAVMAGHAATGEKALLAAAHAWARRGADRAEQESRMSAISSLGAAGALAGVGAWSVNEPEFNLDGSPMVAGTHTDIFGKTYGDMSGEFESIAVDVGNGTLLEAGDAYSPPVGIDPYNP